MEHPCLIYVYVIRYGVIHVLDLHLVFYRRKNLFA